MKKKTTSKKTQDLTSVYIAIISLVVIIIVFFLAYFSKMSKLQQAATEQGGTTMTGQQKATLTVVSPDGTLPSTSNATQQVNAGGVISNMNVQENSGSIPGGNRVRYKIDHFKKLALQPLEFEAVDEKSKPYTPDNLNDINGAKMHYFVVSADLKDFQHLTPTYSDGKWKVLANLPNPGTYYGYVDVSPKQGSPVVIRTDLVVQKDTTGPITYPGLTPNLFAITKDYKATLEISAPLVVQQSVLAYALTNAKDGSAVQPASYFGVPGYVILFRHGNVDSFTNVNPLDSKSASLGSLQFMTTFTKPGRYTAFAEFKFGSKVYTFPITFDVNG